MESESTSLNEEQFRANRFDLVSRLADDLAHEIKNPLNAIVINLEVLRVRAAKGDSEAALERAAVIEYETRRLHHIIDRLLQLLRPERDTAATLALDQVFDELLPLIEARVRLARNEFRTDCATPVMVAAPRDVLKFALLNVVMAVHTRLGEDGGTLAVVCYADSGEARLSVEAILSGDRVLAGADEAYERSIASAAALLASCGGRVEPAANGAVIVVPRA